MSEVDGNPPEYGYRINTYYANRIKQKMHECNNYSRNVTGCKGCEDGRGRGADVGAHGDREYRFNGQDARGDHRDQ